MGNPFDPMNTVGAAGVLYTPAAPAAVGPVAPGLAIDVTFEGQTDTVQIPPDQAGVTRLMWHLYIGCGEAAVKSLWDRLKKRQGELTGDLAKISRALDRSQQLPDESESMKARVRQALAHVRTGWAELVEVETVFLERYESFLLPYAQARLMDRSQDLARWWKDVYRVRNTEMPGAQPDLATASTLSDAKWGLFPDDPAVKKRVLQDTMLLAARWTQYVSIVRDTFPLLKKLRPTPGNVRLAQKYATEIRVRKVIFETLATEVEARHPVALLAYRGLAKRVYRAPGQIGHPDGYLAGPPADQLDMRRGEPEASVAAEQEVILGMIRGLEGARDAARRFEELRLFKNGKLPAQAPDGRDLPPMGAERIGILLAKGWSGHGAVWAQHPMHIQFDADLDRLTSPLPDRGGRPEPGAGTTKMTTDFLKKLPPDAVRYLQRAAVPGSIANRVRKEVFRHVETLLRDRKALIENIALVTAAAGLLLAIPTKGGSIYVAAAIDLALAGYEAAIDVRTYFDDAALGALAISAAERMYWVAPELSLLAGRIAELILRAASDLPLTGLPARLVDAASVVAMLAPAVK
jgi:hypothetical protein